MAAAHAAERGRIVARGVLRKLCGGRHFAAANSERAHSNGDTIQEISTCDWAFHGN